MHLPFGRRRQRADEEVGERGTGMRAAADPTSDDKIAFRDQVGRANEAKVWEGLTEVCHESFDVRVAATWRVQRILQEHIRCGELVYDAEITRWTPEAGESASYDRFIVLFLRHIAFSSLLDYAVELRLLHLESIRKRSAEHSESCLQIECVIGNRSGMPSGRYSQRQRAALRQAVFEVAEYPVRHA